MPRPGGDYVDRETGEPLEVVGQLLPLAPTPSELPWAGREPSLLQLVRPALPEGPQRLPALRQADGAARGLRSCSCLVVQPSFRGFRVRARLPAGALSPPASRRAVAGSPATDTSGAPALTVPTATIRPRRRRRVDQHEHHQDDHGQRRRRAAPRRLVVGIRQLRTGARRPATSGGTSGGDGRRHERRRHNRRPIERPGGRRRRGDAERRHVVRQRPARAPAARAAAAPACRKPPTSRTRRTRASQDPQHGSAQDPQHPSAHDLHHAPVAGGRPVPGRVPRVRRPRLDPPVRRPPTRPTRPPAAPAYFFVVFVVVVVVVGVGTGLVTSVALYSTRVPG